MSETNTNHEFDCAAEASAVGVSRCPAGCDFGELELGRVEGGFMAAVGAAYQHIRCGKCGFSAPATYGKEGAIKEWNEAVSTALSKALGAEGKAL